MAILTSFYEFGKYFPAPIRGKWATFIDTIQATITAASGELNAPYKWSTATGISDPGAGYVKGDVASILSIATLSISATDRSSGNQGAVLASLKNGDTIILPSESTTTTRYIYNVTGAPNNNGTYFTVPVAYSNSYGTLANNELINLTVIHYGATTFLQLSDTPGTYAFQGNRLVAVNFGGSALEFQTVASVLGRGTFLNLSDVPDSYTANAVVAVNATGDGVEFQTVATVLGRGTFLQLSDTPTTYVGQAGKYVVVNKFGTALTFQSAGTSSTTFLALTDTPDDYAGAGGKMVAVKADVTGLEFVTRIDTFLELTDTPSTYSGAGSKVVRVNSGATALEFSSFSFLDLSDTPVDYDESANCWVTVNATQTGLEYTNRVFIALTDVPPSYSGHGGKVVAVNSGETALEFVAAGGGVDTFLELTDTPSAYTGQAGKVVAVNTGETALEFITSPSGVTTFLGLSDTPSSYSGQGGKAVRVNVGATALEFFDIVHLDTNAIHDNVADEIHPITEKEAVVNNDVLLLEDSAASWAKKRVRLEKIWEMHPLPGDIAYLSDGGSNVNSDDLILANAKALQSKEAGGTVRNLILLDSSGYVVIGTSVNDVTIPGEMRIQGGRLSFDNSAWIYADTGSAMTSIIGFSYPNFLLGNGIWNTVLYNGAILRNNEPLQGYNAAETGAYNLANVNASDEVELGSSSLVMNLMGTRIDQLPELANAIPLKGAETGGTARDLIKVDSSNDTIVGNTALDTKLRGLTIASIDIHKFGNVAGGNYTEAQTDGDLMQYGTALFSNEASVESPAIYSSALYSRRVRSMATNNSSQNFFKWGSGASAGDSCHFIVHFSIQVTYTYSGTTYYWTRGGTISGTILKLATSLCKAIAGTVAWDGTGIAFSAAGGSNSPSMGETVSCGTSASAADLGPYFYVNLTGLGYTYVTGECRFTVILTDTDHLPLTGGF